MKKKIIIALAGIIIIIQFFPPQTENPVIVSDLEVEPTLKSIFVRSCYDCHSNQVNWPWYTNVMPIGWLIANDVKEARKEVNFSRWGEYETRRKIRKLNEMKEEIEAGNMPLPSYLFLHGDAKLSESDEKKIYDWIKESISILENPVTDSIKIEEN